ncbi:ABSCISIC ACID-INSENSITIVE 5-like protein 2 [Henckelia pumila]|uniref:ABSCISIC ACID-INSENSITIVE 5-like protein 2 n=1 Tax=Henckelia pumila TaxID=405737 RepID=UPI003C6E960A
MELPKKMGRLQYPFLVRQHHSLIYKNDEIHTNQYQLMKNPPSSHSSSSSSSPPIFQQNLEIPKSFDDVWSDINHVDAMKSTTYPIPPQTNTNGDITLEEFLIRSGAINPRENHDQEGFVDDPAPLMMASGDDHPMLVSSWQQERDVHVPLLVQDVAGSNFRGSEDYFEEKIMDLDMKMPVPIIKEMGGENFSDLLQGEGDTRKRFCTDEMAKKSIERRQRRMIKNRESAARSRARKQEHTNRLLQNKKKLETTIFLLKRRKEAEKTLNSMPTPTPRYQLRRTSSDTSKHLLLPI